MSESFPEQNMLQREIEDVGINIVNKLDALTKFVNAQLIHPQSDVPQTRFFEQQKALTEFDQVKRPLYEALDGVLQLLDKQRELIKSLMDKPGLNGPLFVLPNLQKHIEEAEHDAMTFFKKKCAYCDSDLFDTHTRVKIEFDHYYPIAKGGQDVPWNLLPACKKCNRGKGGKHAKLPHRFVDADRRQRCEEYLHGVRSKLVGAAQQDIEQMQMLRHRLREFLATHTEPTNNTDRSILIELCRLADLEVDDIVAFDAAASKTDDPVLVALIQMIECDREFDGLVVDGGQIYVLAKEIGVFVRKRPGTKKSDALSDSIIGRSLRILGPVGKRPVMWFSSNVG